MTEQQISSESSNWKEKYQKIVEKTWNLITSQFYADRQAYSAHFLFHTAIGDVKKVTATAWLF